MRTKEHSAHSILLQLRAAIGIQSPVSPRVGEATGQIRQSPTNTSSTKPVS